MQRLRLLERDTGQAHAEELRSLFVVSLPRSLSSLLYSAAAHAVGLAEPTWTSDGEILNRDRVPRRLQCLAPSDERFTLLGAAPDAFAGMTGYLDRNALRRGFAYKDVVQPFVVGGWEGLQDFGVLKVRRNVAEVAYTMLKRQWLYPARAASVFDAHRWRKRCGGSTRTLLSHRFATSTAASPGRGGVSRLSGATRSSSGGWNGSSRPCGSGSASTSHTRRSPRLFPSGSPPAASGGIRAARPLRRRVSGESRARGRGAPPRRRGRGEPRSRRACRSSRARRPRSHPG